MRENRSRQFDASVSALPEGDHASPADRILDLGATLEKTLAGAVVEQPRTPQPLLIAIAQEMMLQGAWMRDYAEAQRERVETLRRQIGEQMRVPRGELGRA